MNKYCIIYLLVVSEKADVDLNCVVIWLSLVTSSNVVWIGWWWCFSKYLSTSNTLEPNCVTSNVRMFFWQWHPGHLWCHTATWHTSHWEIWTLSPGNLKLLLDLGTLLIVVNTSNICRNWQHLRKMENHVDVACYWGWFIKHNLCWQKIMMPYNFEIWNITFD